MVRFRTLGCYPCTGAVRSTARTVPVGEVAFEEEDLWRARPRHEETSVQGHANPHSGNGVDAGRTVNPRDADAEKQYSVNLCHVNAPETGFLIRAFGPAAFKGRFNIGYWFWELAELPRSWDIALGYFDEIWVASTFVQAAVAARSPVPVTRIGLVVEARSPAGDWRAHFGIPKGRPAFLCMFDAKNTAERKNPGAAVLALRKARQRHGDLTAVVKVYRPEADRQQVAQLAAALGDMGAVVIDKPLSREETWGLIAACDAYVSLHRGEGFGLAIAEAMALGKPVVATGYSGNMDFMTEENSYPVDFRIVRNPKRAAPYAKGCWWAEADTDHAAALVGEIMDCPKAARAKGEQAAGTIARRFSAETVGKMMKEAMINGRGAENWG